MRTNLDSLVTEKALSIINDSTSSDLSDQLSDDLPLKNVCAKVSPQLSEDIDQVCGFLGISKRRFLEAAFIDAVATAREIIKRECVVEALQGVEAAS